MRTLYFDCAMGAAGDMLTAALLELFEDPAAIIEELNALGIPGVRYYLEKSTKCGIVGSHLRVTVGDAEEHEHMHEHHHDHDHHEQDRHHHEYDRHHHDHEHHHEHHSHSRLADIAHIISHLHLPQGVKDRIFSVYTLMAQAESHAHGVPVEEIHFHEVGTMDAVADISAFCYLMHKLNPQKVCASAIHVGSGQVRCAHGILPVPAPATAHILREVPIYSGDIRGELCTPTGAALLKTFATAFGPMPPMSLCGIGYGMGKKDFPAANCVRAMLGETEEKTEDVVELSCNLDDMTGEEIGFAQERLFAAGALDVFTTPIFMKKNRPGVLLTVLCKQEDRSRLVREIFKHTSTLGIRENVMRRYTLQREFTTEETPFGEVRRKRVKGYGEDRSKAEFEDLAEIARREDSSLLSFRNI